MCDRTSWNSSSIWKWLKPVQLEPWKIWGKHHRTTILLVLVAHSSASYLSTYLPFYLSTFRSFYRSFFLSFFLSFVLSFFLSFVLSFFLYLYLYGGFIKSGVPESPWLFQVTKTKTVIHDARMMPGDTPMTNSRRMAKGKDFTWYHLRTNKGVQCEHVQKWPHAKSKHDNFLTFVIHTLNLQ